MRMKSLLVILLLVATSAIGATADSVSSWNVTAVTATSMAGQTAVVQSHAAWRWCRLRSTNA